MKYLLNKFRYALAGLYTAFTTDHGVQLQSVFLIVTLPIIVWTFNPLSLDEIALIIIAYGLLFITELQNTALEQALDALHPERHDSIKNSKNIAAGSVLLSLIVFTVVIVLLALARDLF